MADIKTIVHQMSLREKIGQVLMLDFRYWGKSHTDKKFIPFTKANSQVTEIIERYYPGGIILFKENIESVRQTVELIHDIQTASKLKLLLGIDQEGGIVTRIATGTNMPGNMSLGASNDYNITESVAQAIGEELYSLGINLNFAPVMDVNSNPKNPIIGIRSFSSSPAITAKLGIAYIKGLQKASVISCMKHFPGHGNTETDSHIGLAITNSSEREINEIDLKPFLAGIKAGADAVMLAHVTAPALDSSTLLSEKTGKTTGIPATLSHKIITELLKKKLDFQGLIFTDALNMKAIADNFTPSETVIKTISAGTDIAVMPLQIYQEKDLPLLEKLFVSLEHEYNNNLCFKERVEESVKKIISFKNHKNIIDDSDRKTSLQARINNAEQIVGCARHQKVESSAACRGITLVKNDKKILPFELKNNTKLLILDNNSERINLMAKSITQISENFAVKTSIETEILVPHKTQIYKQLTNKIDTAELIIILTCNLNSDKNIYQTITSYCNEHNKKLISISTHNPYDIAYIPGCPANLAIYGAAGFDKTNKKQNSLPVNIETAVKAMFKKPDKKTALLYPAGKLPVNIIDQRTNNILYKIGHGLSYT